VMVMWVGWLGGRLPPTDFDGLAQHIPIAAFHVQAGDLARIDTPYRGILAFPANGSLLMGWLFLTTGSDGWIDLVQFPIWILGGVAVYQLARRFGAGRTEAVLGSLVFLAAPVVILQARADYVDVLLAGLAVAALAILFDEQLSLRWRAGLVGCALGVILGVKYAGATYTLVIGSLTLLVIGWNKRGRFRSLLGDAVVFALPVLILGSTWYWSNWRDLANPVWPIQPQAGPIVLFPGVWTVSTFYQDALPTELARLSYPAQLWSVWREQTNVFTPDMRLGGLGPLWLVVGLPALGLMTIQAIRRRELWPLAVIGLAGVLFGLTPVNWNTRYVLAPVAIGGVAAGWLLSQLEGWPRRLLSGLVVLGAAYSFGLVLAYGPITAQQAALFGQLPSAERRASLSKIVPANDEAMRWFDQNVPAGATVAYGWGKVILYPFWGAFDEHRFVYVAPTDAPNWFDRLRQLRVEYLVVDVDSAEAQAAAGDTRFRAGSGDGRYALYYLAE